MPDSLHRPLLGNRITEEDEDEGEDQSPCNDNAANKEDPPLELNRKGSVIEPELTELQGRQ